jgi:adenine-specific DNA-methyltransferase
MSAINDLIAQIEDEGLRQRIEAEFSRLLKQKKFGLVFEEHQPDGLNDGPIYPSFQIMDEVKNAPDKALWHALIEADNYYALQLLAYLYPGMVDCIYIDPPYNTGARDWKYNNDYVDSSDQYRHSKWLSMMKRRLLLAKKLLNPRDSVLIVTIDEKEYLHLGCLLEDLFPEARIQMVSILINPGGVTRLGQFSRTDEYVFFVQFGESKPVPLEIGDALNAAQIRKSASNPAWRTLRRRGAHDLRKDRPNLFYPIIVEEATGKIIRCGESLPLDQSKENVSCEEGLSLIWPLKPDGTEGNWQISQPELMNRLSNGFIRTIQKNAFGWTYSYLAKGEIEKVEKGIYKIVGRGGANNELQLEGDDGIRKNVPGSQWRSYNHNARECGSVLLNNIIGKRFSYPKSLYAVHDCISFFVANKPNALIVDFFAGSGTTLHAVNLLNAEDGGNRRCIMVTNNEVSEQEAKTLTKQGFKPGDEEWERLGIARYVNWPRTVCSIEGHDINGQPLKGEYIGTDNRQMKDGFAANCIFFKLNFLDKTQVALGRQFRELLPILWMKAGAEGICPRLTSDEIPQMLVLPENRFAVLTDEKAFSEFLEKVDEQDSIRIIYLVVDSDSMYREMARCFPKRQTCQLYRDYLDNFRINNVR